MTRRDLAATVTCGVIASLTLWPFGASGASGDSGAHAAPTSTATRTATPSRPRSVLAGTPGYVPPADPESLSTVTGRRRARVVGLSFTNGRPSLEALARVCLSALEAGDEGTLRRLCVDEKEFTAILWPEFPQSRPVTGAKAADGWYFVSRQQYGGIRRVVDDVGRQSLTFVRVEHDAEPVRYANFRLWRRVVIVATDATGTQHRLDFVRAIAERRGSFKLFALRD